MWEQAGARRSKRHTKGRKLPLSFGRASAVNLEQPEVGKQSRSSSPASAPQSSSHGPVHDIIATQSQVLSRVPGEGGAQESSAVGRPSAAGSTLTPDVELPRCTPPSRAEANQDDAQSDLAAPARGASSAMKCPTEPAESQLPKPKPSPAPAARFHPPSPALSGAASESSLEDVEYLVTPEMLSGPFANFSDTPRRRHRRSSSAVFSRDQALPLEPITAGCHPELELILHERHHDFFFSEVACYQRNQERQEKSEAGHQERQKIADSSPERFAQSLGMNAFALEGVSWADVSPSQGFAADGKFDGPYESPQHHEYASRVPAPHLESKQVQPGRKIRERSGSQHTLPDFGDLDHFRRHPRQRPTFQLQDHSPDWSSAPPGLGPYPAHFPQPLDVAPTHAQIHPAPRSLASYRATSPLRVFPQHPQQASLGVLNDSQYRHQTRAVSKQSKKSRPLTQDRTASYSGGYRLGTKNPGGFQSQSWRKRDEGGGGSESLRDNEHADVRLEVPLDLQPRSPTEFIHRFPRQPQKPRIRQPIPPGLFPATAPDESMPFQQ